MKFKSSEQKGCVIIFVLYNIILGTMWKMDYIKVILVVILVRGDGDLHQDGIERAGL